jgi:hypothetical protein
MSEKATRLDDDRIDKLADALETFAKPSSKLTFHNYDLAFDPNRRVGVQRARDVPGEGLTTSATFGLAHEDWSHNNMPDRVELVFAWDSPELQYERLLVTVAETILRIRQVPKPGIIYRDAAEAARLPELKARMPHATILFPYLWGNDFQKVDLGTTKVWFLQLVPIDDKERAFIEKNGFAKFEELLGYDGARFERLQRPSHIQF